jgi:hypothetical protein
VSCRSVQLKLRPRISAAQPADMSGPCRKIRSLHGICRGDVVRVTKADHLKAVQNARSASMKPTRHRAVRRREVSASESSVDSGNCREARVTDETPDIEFMALSPTVFEWPAALPSADTDRPNRVRTARRRFGGTLADETRDKFLRSVRHRSGVRNYRDHRLSRAFTFHSRRSSLGFAGFSS